MPVLDAIEGSADAARDAAFQHLEVGHRRRGLVDEHPDGQGNQEADDEPVLGRSPNIAAERSARC
jgi:hypothetical protein